MITYNSNNQTIWEPSAEMQALSVDSIVRTAADMYQTAGAELGEVMDQGMSYVMNHSQKLYAAVGAILANKGYQALTGMQQVYAQGYEDFELFSPDIGKNMIMTFAKIAAVGLVGYAAWEIICDDCFGLRK